MEIRKGFESSLKDIETEFDFLSEYGFVKSGCTQLPHRASVGYKGDKYNILLSYEFIEEVFDFAIIKADDPNISKPLWKLIAELDTEFKYSHSKPTQFGYKVQLRYLAEKFKAILPSVLSSSYVMF